MSCHGPISANKLTKLCTTTVVEYQDTSLKEQLLTFLSKVSENLLN